ncbi:hypothetical protein [Desulfocapsa sulfexigens]|nr:hypothetical protein [Desulfocapsa sulfexigens]
MLPLPDWKRFDRFNLDINLERGTLILGGSSDDALQNMKLVCRIYLTDPEWRNTYDIPDPDNNTE